MAAGKEKEQEKGTACAVFEVDLGAYSLEAVYGACYIFLDRYYISLERPAENTIRVKAQPKVGVEPNIAIEGEFKNELLNQVLREKIAARNARLREYIIGRALYGAETQAEIPGATQSYLDDPMGIAVPWEDKYGKDDKK
jgi:His-Xaa-Ser system protein HxsD